MYCTCQRAFYEQLKCKRGKEAENRLEKIDKVRISFRKVIFLIAESTVILPNFLAWKFCGKAQFPPSRHLPAQS